MTIEVPTRGGLTALRRAAAECQGCGLYRDATQTVFGAGPADARMVLVGEQPGDREDLAGEPFVGPAGMLLDRALGDAGIDRDEVYVTNAVKHFKFTLPARGKRRIHQKPSQGEVSACRPWLLAELDRVRPELVVCLGATAASALLGPDFRVSQRRGEIVAAQGIPAMATVHPSAVLRAPDREAAYRGLVADLTVAARHQA
ncbi:UdgX family uracil-DNA binding protein [Kutzneria buriramensis]|uniref:Type-4 uracil-DNA glycosylase n=1 Tax=Kutzneria buriramensis TaxID=1045776 RepID=A0A3E0I6G5_9PSEU|nr:UdgX family uracil-DNA binding protein [Kutzneria buriramensis]REH54344.1 DNA polymerase [Kutzneria buriramensis]